MRGATSASVTLKAVAQAGALKLLDQQAYQRGVKRLKLGDGESVVIRIEREADAKRHHRLKWYYGYILRQLSEHTGYPVPELDAMCRALFLPSEIDTLSRMSDDQMAVYNQQCEDYAADTVGVVITGPMDARTWTTSAA